jgi:hypothetical protein
MKPSMPLGFILAAVAATAFAAEEAPIPKISENNTAAVAPSPTVSKNIISGLPKYQSMTPAPAPAAKPETPGGPGGAVDPDLLVLPTMVVKQKPRPRLTDDVVYKDKKDFGALFAKQNYTQLDQALNKFTLPLFGTSLEARAYDDYMRMKNQQMQEDVNQLSKAVEAVDAAEAKALREAATKP